MKLVTLSDVDVEDIDLLALPPAVEALLFDDILRRDFVAFVEMVLATIAPGILDEPKRQIGLRRRQIGCCIQSPNLSSVLSE